MRRVILLFISCCTLIAGPACSNRVEPLPDDTSLVLVVVDALRSDRLGAWGGDPGVTPCLDRMAGESVRFRHAVAPSSWTKPSVASLMTGFYPGRHGAVGLTRSLQRYGGSTRLDSGQVTLAETLRQAGFSTAAYTTNINISVRNNFHQGFDQFVQRAGDADELCTGALEWLDGRQPGERFFLYLHILDPHAPYTPPEPFRGQFADPDPPEGGPFSRRGWPFEMEWWAEQYGRWLDSPGGQPFRYRYSRFDLDWARRHLPEFDDPELDIIVENKQQFREKVDLEFTGLDDPALQRRIGVLTSLYDGEVAWVDQELSRFFDGLEDRGLLSRSVVIITSDHGEAFLEHRSWGHHLTVYGEEIDIPLFFRVPQRSGGLLQGEVEPIVSLVDLYPTVLEMFGLPLPAETDGVSLWPAIRGDGELLREGPVYSELLLDNREYVAALQGNRKLIRTVDRRGKVGWELYDVGLDPGEQKPTGYEHDASTARALRAGIEAHAAARDLLAPGENEAARLSEQEIERLDTLGYLAREEAAEPEAPAETP